MQLIVDSEKSLAEAARKIIDIAGDYKIWIFDGDMGAGKTTLIKNIGVVYQIVDNISSPSFSLVNEYADIEDNLYYHFDFYRIKNELEAMDIGVEEYFDSGEICFIEWPQKIPSLIPEEHMLINIEILSPNSRKLTIKLHDK